MLYSFISYRTGERAGGGRGAFAPIMSYCTALHTQHGSSGWERLSRGAATNTPENHNREQDNARQGLTQHTGTTPSFVIFQQTAREWRSTRIERPIFACGSKRRVLSQAFSSVSHQHHDPGSAATSFNPKALIASKSGQKISVNVHKGVEVTLPSLGHLSEEISPQNVP